MKALPVIMIVLGILLGPALACADDGPAASPLIDDLRFGLAFTSTLINGDGGLSGVAEYNLFSYGWIGAQLAWNKMKDELSQVWPAATFRWVAPASDVGDFQAFLAVGGAGHGVNFRLEAGPMWRFGDIDVSLTVGFIHVGSAVERFPQDLEGYCLTFGVFGPGH